MNKENQIRADSIYIGKQCDNRNSGSRVLSLHTDREGRQVGGREKDRNVAIYIEREETRYRDSENVSFIE